MANNLKLKAIGLPSSLTEKLANQSIFTVQEYLTLNFIELQRKTGLTYQKLSAISDAVSRIVAPLPTVVSQLKQPTFIHFQDELDDILQGGIQCGQITEFSGAPGMGKSQLCHQLALSCTLEEKSNGVLYIDSEGAFSSSRLLEIAVSKFEIGCQEKLLSCLNRVHLWHPQSFKNVLERLINIEVFIIKNRIKLLIIDSIGSLIRRDFGLEKSIERGAQMCSLSSRLKQMAHDYKLAVVVTNHIAAHIDSHSERTSLIPALGPSWSHWINSRLHLMVFQNKRRLVISKSAEIPEVYVDYTITVKGIEIHRNLD